jgi:spermidine synthase
MSPRFEELDWRSTPIGESSLRRRVEPRLGVEVFEAKLDDEFLMSSLFTASEEALATLGLARVPDGAPLEVLVGGLGLGYTAVAALRDPRVGTLVVVEALDAVIDWHHRRLLPVSAQLMDDARTHVVHGDFFALAGAEGLPGVHPTGRRYDATRVDIDHTPRHVLDASHEPFYSAAGLGSVRGQLRPGGVFGLWSDDPPDSAFLDLLGSVFVDAEAHVVDFPNPLTDGRSACTVYCASAPGSAGEPRRPKNQR